MSGMPLVLYVVQSLFYICIVLRRIGKSRIFCTPALLAAKDEFTIEPRYTHKKNLDKSEKKSYGGSKLIYENNFTIKKPRKNSFNALG